MPRIVRQTTTGAAKAGGLPVARHRKGLRQADPKPPKPGPVEVRPIERYWSKEEAIQLIKDGYSPSHISDYTGWPEAVLVKPKSKR